MPVPAIPELLIILAIFILLFGATRLPKLARGAGQAIREFRSARDSLESDDSAT